MAEERRLSYYKIEERLSKLEDVVIKMSNKIFNGFGGKIDDTLEKLKDEEDRLRKLEATQTSCLSRQETEKEMLKKYEHKMQLYLGFIALIASFPIWKHFIGG
jgi:hypothetical protein